MDRVYGLLVYDTSLCVWSVASNYLYNELIASRLKPTITSGFAIGDFVTVLDVEETYPRYVRLVEDEDYFNKFTYGRYPKDVVHKIIDVKNNKPNNDTIYIIESFEGEVFLVGEKGVGKITTTNEEEGEIEGGGDILELVCRELEVEIGEEWLASDGLLYIIDEKGALLFITLIENLLGKDMSTGKIYLPKS